LPIEVDAPQDQKLAGNLGKEAAPGTLLLRTSHKHGIVGNDKAAVPDR
jgi:hypothetical protein